MQLFASTKTQLAPKAASPVTALEDIAATPDTVANPAQFKTSFAQASTQQDTLSDDAAPHNLDIPAPVETNEQQQSKTEAAETDWHELIAQSDAQVQHLSDEVMGESRFTSLVTEDKLPVEDAKPSSATESSHPALAKRSDVSDIAINQQSLKVSKTPSEPINQDSVMHFSESLPEPSPESSSVPSSVSSSEPSSVPSRDIATSKLTESPIEADATQNSKPTQNNIATYPTSADTTKLHVPNTMTTEPTRIHQAVVQQEIQPKLVEWSQDDGLNTLLQLSPKQLEQVSQQITQRLESSQRTLGASMQFVSNLQGGLAEIKAQLSQGHEPGIDLSSLINQSITKLDVQLKPEGMLKSEPILSAVTQTLAGLFPHQGSMTGQALDTYLGAMEPVRQNNEIAIGQFEQNKLAAQSQSTNPAQSAFDKSVNMFKPEGQQQLVEKVRWMNNNQQLTAEMRLDPAELGAMQVKISMNGDTATVNMIVQNTQARDALDQASSRLKEMLAEQGLSLGESSVNQEHSGHSAQDPAANAQQHTDSGTTQQPDLGLNEQTGNDIANETIITNGALGGIDYYA